MESVVGARAVTAFVFDIVDFATTAALQVATHEAPAAETRESNQL